MIHRKNLIKLIAANGYRHSHWQVFSDFMELSAISLSNAVDWSQRDGREARYMEVIDRYSKEEVARFPQMLAELVMAMEAGAADVLGDVFMEMELASKWHGQFFTPMSVCRMMAKMMVDDRMRELIAERGFIRANEPACGGGAMVIALADEMRQAGINYQRHLHVVAQDVEFKAVCMAYVQLSLLHVPAVVIHGNTLTVETRSQWLTPAHVIGGWRYRLGAADRRDAESDGAAIVVKQQAPAALPSHQVSAVHQHDSAASRDTTTASTSQFPLF